MTRTQLIVERNKRRAEIRRKISGWVFTFAFLSVGMIPTLFLINLNASELTPEDMTDGQLYCVEATAYCGDEITASGRPTINEQTLAGPVEWLGYTCELYDEDMNFMGYRQFTDTGYGKDGDILRGETIDLYIGGDEAYEKCIQWGRRKVYIRLLGKAKG